MLSTPPPFPARRNCAASPGCAQKARSPLALRVFWAAALASATSLLSSGANAQSSTVLIQPAIQPDYERGRNVSVVDRPHPDYDALGVQLGSFLVAPSVGLAMSYTDNAYYDNLDKKSDAFAVITPVVSVTSNWSRNLVSVTGSADIRRYATQTIKNQAAWFLGTQDRLDLTRDVQIEFTGQIDRTYESPFYQDVASNLAVPSNYVRKFAALKGTYELGRGRIIGTADISNFAFSNLLFAGGGVRDQQYRDQTIYRAAGQYEYALSPSLSVYGEVVVDRTQYFTLISGLPNRDSTAYSLIFGTNFDLAGLARGSIGLGYTDRNFDASAIYPAARGVSVQAKVEFFPTVLTTISVSLQRQLEDVTVSNGSAYWDNRITVNVDREVLQNLILSASGDLSKRDYNGVAGAVNAYIVQGKARYQASRWLGFNAAIGYSIQRPTTFLLGDPINEFSALLGVRFRR